MKFRSISTILLAIFFMSAPISGNANVGYEEAYKASTSMAELANAVISMKIQVYSTLTALKGLNESETANFRERFQVSSDELEKLIKNAALLPEQATEMAALGSEYFSALKQEAVQKAGEEEAGVSGELEQSFYRAQKEMEMMGQYFEPVIVNLKNVQQAFNNVLNEVEAAPTADLITQTESYARKLYLTLDKLSRHCGDLARSMAPEGVDIDGMIADEVEKELGMVDAIEAMEDAGEDVKEENEETEEIEDAEDMEGAVGGTAEIDQPVIEEGQGLGLPEAGVDNSAEEMDQTAVPEMEQDAVQSDSVDDVFREMFDTITVEEAPAVTIPEQGEVAVEQETLDLSPVGEETSEKGDLMPAEEMLELEPPVVPEPAVEIEWPEETGE